MCGLGQQRKEIAMSDYALRLPARASLEQLRKQAKELLKNYRAGDSVAIERFCAIIPQLVDSSSDEDVALSDAQFVLAREFGFENWAALKQHIEVLPNPKLEPYETVAADIVKICSSDDPEALQRITELIGRTYPYPDRRKQIQQHLAVIRGPESRIEDITVSDARLIVARRFGFESWAELAEQVTQPPTDPRSARLGMSTSPPFYKIDGNENKIELRPPISDRDWETIFSVIRDNQITSLDAGGQMTDAALEWLSQIEQVTTLNISGSKKLTDSGLKQLSRMTQLQELDLSEYPGGRLTDRGLEFLRDLPELKRFQMCWQSGISDVGVANLAYCNKLESVDLLGTPTGDGAIRALIGKKKLRKFKSGKMVTDAGIPLLHQFPVFKSWHGGQIQYSLMNAGADPNHLLLDGSFTNEGFRAIAGLDGLFALTFFWHISKLTAEGLKSLIDLPNLGFLGCQDKLCDDEAMRRIAGIPRLRMLMGQGTVASDNGFVELSRSKTIEYIWGRECVNLHSRGFKALAGMPSLKGLAVSCKGVDDAGLSSLPSFPALRGLMPMDVSDAGFKHVGGCENLEELWCMYCRDTGDTATEHITGLSKLKTYYAGATQITDRSLEFLGQMSSLESMEFYECSRITNAGVARLGGMPSLKEITIGGSPNVTREGMSVFPKAMRVNYW
jgi:hypothetical protein